MLSQRNTLMSLKIESSNLLQAKAETDCLESLNVLHGLSVSVGIAAHSPEHLD